MSDFLTGNPSHLTFQALILVLSFFKFFTDLFENVVKVLSKSNEPIDDRIWSSIILAHNFLKEREQIFNFRDDLNLLFGLNARCHSLRNWASWCPNSAAESKVVGSVEGIRSKIGGCSWWIDSSRSHKNRWMNKLYSTRIEYLTEN